MTTFIKEVNKKELTFAERKLEGLRKRRPNKVSYILKVEQLWEKYALERTEVPRGKLINSLKFVINKKANDLSFKWKNTTLTKEDFESVFYESTWKLLDRYQHYNDFYFYETFLIMIDKRTIDVTRGLKTLQGSFENEVLPLKEETAEYLPSNVNIENEVMNRDLVAQILSEDTLTLQKKQLLEVIYNNPDASYREIAKELGLNHPEQVSRSLKAIKKKLLYIFL